MEVTRRALLVGAASTGAAAIAFARADPTHLLRNASQRQRPSSSGRVVNVRQRGALGNGNGDDRPAIQAAIDLLAGTGGGTLFFPAGTYMVSSNGSAVAITLKSGVTLAGEGGASVLKLKDAAGGHLVNAARETGCAVQDLVLDGNRDRQPTPGHGFRAGGVVGLVIRNVEIRNAHSYGIGIEGGSNRDVLIENVSIHDTGADGIDIKNRKNGNANFTIRNVTVRRWGLRADKSQQAGIDCRGQVRLSNIKVSDPGSANAVGIRMRQGETSSPGGLGAHHSTLDRFEARMGPAREQVGVAVVARDVTISNGTISGGSRGLLVQESGFRGSAIRIDNCADAGVLVDAYGKGLDGDGALLSACVITGCGDGIDVEADDVQIVRCASRNNRRFGVVVRSTAERLGVVGGDFSGNGLGPIQRSGAAISKKAA